jgi:hypothetical protein
MRAGASPRSDYKKEIDGTEPVREKSVNCFVDKTADVITALVQRRYRSSMICRPRVTL